MQSALLTVSVDPIALGVLIGVGVLALIALLYGIFRKFPRVSWLSWQVAAVFGLTLIADAVPRPNSDMGTFALAAGLLVGGSIVILIIGGVVRGAMLGVHRAPLFFRVMSRLLGGVTAVFNLAVFALCLGAPVLKGLEVFGLSGLEEVFGQPVWSEFFGKYAVDFFLVAFCLVMVRAGYRIGLARSLWTMLTLALAAGALVLAFFMALRVPFLADLAVSIAGAMSSLGSAAGLLGTIIVAAIVFFVFLIVIILINLLINLLVGKLNGNRVLSAIDGAIMSLVFLALFTVVVLGADYGVHFLVHADLSALPANVGEIAGKVEALFTASPLAQLLYTCNPVLGLLPA